MFLSNLITIKSEYKRQRKNFLMFNLIFIFLNFFMIFFFNNMKILNKNTKIDYLINFDKNIRIIAQIII